MGCALRWNFDPQRKARPMLRPVQAPRSAGPLAVAVALAALAGSSTFGLADGALYVALPKKGLRDGFAYGFAHARATEAEAKTDAKRVCEDQARTVNIRAGACQLIETFKKRCVSVAMDSTDKWAGWAVGDSKDDADKLALEACAKGASTCVVHESVCDE
jgi:hypothetical protein